MITIEDCVCDYLMATVRSRQGATNAELWTVANRILSHIGDVKLTDLTHVQLTDCTEKIIAGIRADKGNESGIVGHTTANKAIVLLKSALRRAVDIGVIPRSPLDETSLYEANEPRQEVLSSTEIPRVLAAAEMETPVAGGFILMIMYTGMRKGEVAGAKWKHVMWDDGMLILPKTKSGKQQKVALPPVAVALLGSLYKASSQDPDHYIFHGAGGGTTKRYDIRHILARIMKRAGITRKIWPHDLRRTVGLVVSRKHGLHIASKVLRHSSVQITERAYAPLDTEEIRAGVSGLYD